MTWTLSNGQDSQGVTASQTSFTVTAGTNGDLRIIQFLIESSTISVSSLSGGGVTTWHQAGTTHSVSSASVGVACNAQIFYGTVTGSGTALTITYSATIGTTSCLMLRQDFRSDRIPHLALPNYSVVNTGFGQTGNITSTSPMTFASVNSTRQSQLFVGTLAGSGETFTGSTAGFTYGLNSLFWAYNLSCPANAAQAPQETFTGTGGWYTIDAVFDDGFVPRGNQVNQAVKRSNTY